MTKDEAIQFLRGHQPLPDDDSLSGDLAVAFDEARSACDSSPEPEMIPLLLGSFGSGDGFGTYVRAINFFRRFHADEIVPHLALALDSPHPGVRYWSAQVAAFFPSRVLVAPLLRILKRPGDEPFRYAALTALEDIEAAEISEALQQLISVEMEENTRALALEILESRQAS